MDSEREREEKRRMRRDREREIVRIEKEEGQGEEIGRGIKKSNLFSNYKGGAKSRNNKAIKVKMKSGRRKTSQNMRRRRVMSVRPILGN